ncbi:MAG: PEP/pyruvate-binding domain-containing protein [Nitrospirota bacterium]
MVFDILGRLKKDRRSALTKGEERKLFRKKYLYFKNLLSSNNEVLEIMADMEEKFSGEFVFDRYYIDSNTRKLSDKVYSIIENLNSLSDEKYYELYGIYKRIKSEVEDILTKKIDIPVTGPVIPIENIDREMIGAAGGKMANLGEVKNRLGLPVPEGFAVTAYAFKKFMDHNNLTSEINKKLYILDLKNMEGLQHLSKEIQDMILNAEMPADLKQSIIDSYERIIERTGRRVSMSVRSSAVQEDGEFSFAGQYATALGVMEKDVVIAKYKEILASLFTPRAIFYYRTKGFTEEDMVMSVGIMTMIDAKMSGVMYSHDPNDPHKGVIIINAVWGLGTNAVDGQVSPYIYVVSKNNNVVLEQKAAVQKTMMTIDPENGIVEVDVPEELERQSGLDAKQIFTLAEYANTLEKHYNRPQDIEWAIDGDDNIYILQTRPLKISNRSTRVKSIPTRVEGYNILIDKGAIACKGIAAGKAFFVRKEEDLHNFPSGAVLVARHTSPKFVTVMDKASAIITDIGSATGHMASLSREFQVPTILNTNVATSVIEEGQEITVDAINSNIYEGRVIEIIELAAKREDFFKITPLFKTLRKVLKKIVPLNLVDPEDTTFVPQYCRTFHDITRFSHEKAMNEMFRISDREEVKKGDAVKLALKIPLDISLVDLGSGIEEGYKNVGIKNIRSKPMVAFLNGLMSAKWPGPRPSDVQGIPSATQKGKLYEKSFAMVSEEYMNFSIRLGYHLSTVEAYAGSNTNDNYIQFFFKGGGASMDRRLRRATLISGILESLDFRIKRSGDVIEAKITKYDEPSIIINPANE